MAVNMFLCLFFLEAQQFKLLIIIITVDVKFRELDYPTDQQRIVKHKTLLLLCKKCWFGFKINWQNDETRTKIKKGYLQLELPKEKKI